LIDTNSRWCISTESRYAIVELEMASADVYDTPLDHFRDSALEEIREAAAAGNRMQGPDQSY
jgi:hypothetical protein